MDTLLHRYTRSHMNRGLGGCFKKMFSSTILFWSFINFNVLSGQIFEKKVNLGTVKKPWRLQNINRFSLWNYFAFWKSGSLLINTLLENFKLCPKNQVSEKWRNCEFEFLCQKMVDYFDLKIVLKIFQKSAIFKKKIIL